MLQPLFLGKQICILPAPYYDIENFAAAISTNKADHLFVIPDLITELLNSPSTIRFDLSSVKSVTCSSGELRPSIERGLYAAFKSLERVNECYAAAESGVVAVAPVAKEKWPRPVGIIEPGYEVKVVNLLDGNDLGAGDRGELCIRSPFMMLNYYPDDTISEQGYDDFGWYHTGDYGCYDDIG